MISVLILTFNEERNLSACLKSVQWSDDVLVLDSFSTDKTVEIAEAAGARVLKNCFINFAEQRNFGIEQGSWKHEWILHLDADEVVPTELHQEMISRICNPEFDAYKMASKFIFEDRWLRYSSLYPSYQVRLGRREVLRFVQVGHGQRENLPAGQTGTMKQALLHYAFSKGIDDWKKKHDRYSADEAKNIVENVAGRQLDWPGLLSKDALRRRRALKDLAGFLPFRPSLRFVYMYFFRLGILDGVPGFRYCCLLALYESMIQRNIRELRRKKQGQ